MLKWLFKEVDDPKEKIRRDIKKLCKHAITLEYKGDKYDLYELATIHDMPAKRYQIMNKFIENARLNLEKEELIHYLDELLTLLQKAGKNDPQAFADSLVLAKYLKAKTAISLDIDLVMRVLSCVFLFEDEDPLDYDWDINNLKIKMMEEAGVTAFF